MIHQEQHGLQVITTIKGTNSDQLAQIWINHLFTDCPGSGDNATRCTFRDVINALCRPEPSSILRATCFDVTREGEVGDFTDDIQSHYKIGQRMCFAIEFPSTVQGPYNWTVRPEGVDGCTYN